jgi:hypothetical protein
MKHNTGSPFTAGISTINLYWHVNCLFFIKIYLMKKLFSKQFYISLMSTLLLAFTQVAVWAQDSASSTTSTTSSTSTSTEPMAIQPWMWVVGGAIVLIIIIALVRSGSKEKVIVTKESTHTIDNL